MATVAARETVTFDGVLTFFGVNSKHGASAEGTYSSCAIATISWGAAIDEYALFDSVKQVQVRYG